MAHGLTTTTTAEIEVGLSGTFCPAVPASGPSRSCGGEPGEEAHTEDHGVTSLSLLVFVSPGQHKAVNLLDGVDLQSAAWLKISANLLEALGFNRVDEALMMTLDEQVAA